MKLIFPISFFLLPLLFPHSPYHYRILQFTFYIYFVCFSCSSPLSGLQENESFHLFSTLMFTAPGAVSGAQQVHGRTNVQGVCEGWGAATPSPLRGPLVPSLGMASLSPCPHPLNPQGQHRTAKLLSQGKGFQMQADPPSTPPPPTSPTGASSCGALHRESSKDGGGIGADTCWVLLGKPGTCSQPCVLNWKEVRAMSNEQLLGSLFYRQGN